MHVSFLSAFSPVDVQYTNEGGGVGGCRHLAVDAAHYPAKELRVEVLG